MADSSAGVTWSRCADTVCFSDNGFCAALHAAHAQMIYDGFVCSCAAVVGGVQQMLCITH